MGINIIKMNCFPLLNTVFLVYSGIFFVLVQFKEYSDSIFSFNDSCYGSVFFLLTGFHGFHVIVGLIFLLICCYRLYLTYKFSFYELNKNLYFKKIFKVFFLKN